MEFRCQKCMIVYVNPHVIVENEKDIVNQKLKYVCPKCKYSPIEAFKWTFENNDYDLWAYGRRVRRKKEYYDEF